MLATSTYSINIHPSVQYLRSAITASSKMDSTKKTHDPDDLAPADVLIKLFNFVLFLGYSRKGTNFRWANFARDAPDRLRELTTERYTKIYGRITSRYNYHPQQQHENVIRRFDVVDSLRVQMEHSGSLEFYKAVLGQNHIPNMIDREVDLTRIKDLSSSSASGDYIYSEIRARKGEEAAKAARTCYRRGFSRVVNVMDDADWDKLREELRDGKHLGASTVDSEDENVIFVAVSYKGKSVKMTRRMRFVNEDGTPKEDEGLLAQTEIEMTSDFVDDFRWSQVIRSCMALAKQKGTNRFRLWIDRLVMMNVSKEERARIYKMLDWEEFGLFAYAVCPVIRLYGENERLYGTDFWRKLETVLGVAGRGLVVDDYMLRKYDYTIFFGESMYVRLDDGVSNIGGTGTYIKSVTLALATAILTDGVSVSAANEDLRTVGAASAWKAWALRTIAEGAYSRSHSSMMRKEEPFVVSYREFMTIAFWESIVSQCSKLTGKSYLDMSYQKSRFWLKSSNWDGIIEWIGMLQDSCEVRDRAGISNFLSKNTVMGMWTSTSGHAASIISLRTPDLQHKRCIVVNLSRFATVRRGHVIAVAEATGLRSKRILPPYMRFKQNPDKDQIAKIGEDGVVQYEYKPMQIEFVFMQVVRPLVLLLLTVLVLGIPVPFVITGAPVAIVFAVIYWFFAIIGVSAAIMVFVPWPWVDQCDVGEAVFDNLLLHSLYGSGIKKQYRNMRASYREIGWK